MGQLGKMEKSYSTLILLLGVWGHLRRGRRVQIGLLFVVSLFSGLAEFVSLGAALPFLAVLSDPDRYWQEPLVHAFALRVGITNVTQLLILAAVVFAVAAVFVAFIRLVNLWLNGRLAAAVGSDLSFEAYRCNLFQPYEVHVHRNSAAVITAMSTQTNATVSALNSFLQLATSVVVSASLLIGLFLIDPPVAFAAVALFGSSYGLVALALRSKLRINGLQIAKASSQQLKALQEGLGAIRDVLLDGSQSTYLQIYREADRPQRRLVAQNAFLGSFPRYVIEALGMVAIAFLGGLLVLQRGSGVAVIPLLGAMALGAQRLLPAMQQIYSSWANLKGNNAAIHAVLTMLNQPVPSMVGTAPPLSLLDSVRLSGVFYRYGPDQPDVLKELNLKIHRGERLGLIGSTGSGKSTLVDLLMGLLKPMSGQLLVDGKDLYDPEDPSRLVSWRAAISHVPQNIYLIDASIAENIAFGIPRNKINFDRVIAAAEQAQIADFVDSLPNGYDSFVGERGIRLSGGQRQRIGIARALYKQAKIIVFDEATSALDNDTESAVMQTIEELSHSLTVIIIAHRLSTVYNCHRVIELKDGRIVRQMSGDMISSLL